MAISLIIEPWVFTEKSKIITTNKVILQRGTSEYANEGEHFWQERAIRILGESLSAMQCLACDASIIVGMTAYGKLSIGQVVARTGISHETVEKLLEEIEKALDEFCTTWPKSEFTIIVSQTCAPPIL